MGECDAVEIDCRAISGEILDERDAYKEHRSIGCPGENCAPDAVRD